jgi:hypothetical protein
MGTDPLSNDTDNDGLNDGYEMIYETNPLSGDSDGDNLTDMEEIDLRLDPLNNDTDGDGVLDSVELNWGTDPLKGDSDGDGIPDGEDTDSVKSHVDSLVLAFDPSPEALEFAENLGEHSNVTIVTVEELLLNYTDESRIVLMGRPDSNESVGNLIFDLLEDTGSVLTDMSNSTENRIAVRYGVWIETQTIVMISEPLWGDHIQVLDALREKIVTIQPNSVNVEYNRSIHYEFTLNNTLISQNAFKLDDIDIVKQTDAELWAYLSDDIQPTIDINKYNTDTTPISLNQSNGLGQYEKDAGKYVDLTINDKTGNQSGNFIDEALIKIYYTESELDRNGDGDADDIGDLDESTLGLYRFDESAEEWEILTADLDWVVDWGLNTTNFVLYGNSYEGCIWVRVTHLSLFGMAALPYNRPPDVSQAVPSVEYIWSPNHTFVDINIEGVTDPDGDEITITILEITTDEPTATAKGAGGAKHAPDAYGVGTNTASVRAERSGNGNGRVYVITFVAKDGRGGETIGSVAVFVPLNQGKNKYDVIDDGQYYDATKIN